MKSFAPKDGGSKPPAAKGGGRNAERNFHSEKRRNDTHSSTTDPDARLFRKGAGKEAKLCHMGHLMTENRNGLIVDARLTEANGAIAVILPNNDSVVLCAQRISGGPLLIAYC